MVKTQVFPSPSLYAVHAAWLMDGKSIRFEATAGKILEILYLM